MNVRSSFCAFGSLRHICSTLRYFARRLPCRHARFSMPKKRSLFPLCCRTKSWTLQNVCVRRVVQFLLSGWQIAR